MGMSRRRVRQMIADAEARASAPVIVQCDCGPQIDALKQEVKLANSESNIEREAKETVEAKLEKANIVIKEAKKDLKAAEKTIGKLEKKLEKE